MSETRSKYDPEFREGAVRIVRETGKPIAHVGDDLGINPGALGSWVKKERIERGEAVKTQICWQLRGLDAGKA